MTITSYDTLVSNLQELTEDDGTEFLAYIPTIIELAEDRLFRELDLPELEAKDTGTLALGVSTLAKPADYEFGEYLLITISGVRQQLRKKMESYIHDYWPSPTLTATPRYYADESKENFIVAPTPDSNYAYELKYTAKPVKLSSTNQTNYYILNCLDVLYAACMAEAARFMKAWSQVADWEGKVNLHRDTWNIEVSRYRRDGNIMPNTPDTGPNSLKHTIDSNA